MTPRDLQLGQSTIPNDMNSSRGNRGFLEGKEPHSDARDCAFFQSMQDVEDGTILKDTSKQLLC